MTQNKKLIYFSYSLIMVLIFTSACSRKAVPEITHSNYSSNKNLSVTKPNLAKTTSTPTIKSNGTVTDNSSSTPSTSNKSTAIPKTNNTQLNHFLNQGCQKTLLVEKVTPEDLIKSARKYLGTPHRMGGTSNKGMDCSGLVMMAFADNGIRISHNSEDQARYGNIILDKENLREGDLLFFIKTYKTTKYITHVGIYLGNNQMLHTSSNNGVSITSIDMDYWKEKFIFGTRVF